MRLRSIYLAISFCLAAGLSAQATQTLRGEVEDVQNTLNQFYLQCTNISLISSTVNLRQFEQTDADLIMQVRDVTTPGGRRTLDVVSAVPTPEIMDMGNLRFGRSESWEVNVPSGSFALVFFDFTSNTTYRPFGSVGTYLLGPSALTLRSGFTNNGAQFRFNFQFPTIPSLVGTLFTSQALVVEPNGAIYFSDTDCKDVRNN